MGGDRGIVGDLQKGRDVSAQFAAMRGSGHERFEYFARHDIKNVGVAGKGIVYDIIPVPAAERKRLVDHEPPSRIDIGVDQRET